MTATVTNINSESQFGSYVKSLDWFQCHTTPFDPVLDGFLYSTETMLLYGASGSGKSLFAFGLAAAYADEDENRFVGQEVGTGSVLYVDGEMHNNSIAARVELFGVESVKSVDYLPMIHIVDEGRTVDLSVDSQQEQLLELVEQSGYKLVVLDSVRTLFDLADENSASSWSGVNKLVMMLRAKGAAVIAVHHSNKASYSNGGEVIWSGSSNAITVFDRTCGIARIADATWSLCRGHKEGRSGHGFSRWVDEDCYQLEEGQGFVRVNLEDERISRLIEWCSDYEPSERVTTRARDAVRSLSKALGVTFAKTTVDEAWVVVGGLLSFEIDAIPFSTKEDFKRFVKEGSGDEWSI